MLDSRLNDCRVESAACEGPEQVLMKVQLQPFQIVFIVSFLYNLFTPFDAAP